MDLIFREHPTSDDAPPWKGMSFRQQVYSDAMLECLRLRYPQGANFRERKHLAAIEFLQQELKEMRTKEAASMAPSSPKGSVQDVNLTDCQHGKSTSSSHALSSSLPLPALTDGHRLDRNFGQEIVFSLASGPMAQGKKRKKMTQEEKDDYRKTRKIGACDNCKRHKAKCKHVTIVSDDARGSQPTTGMSPRGRPSGSSTTTPISNMMQENEPKYQAAHQTPDLSQEHEVPVKTSPMVTASTTPGSSQWREDMKKEAQSESSGYVPVSATSWPYDVSPHSAFDPWGSFDPRLLEMNYPGHPSFNESCEGFPMSLSNGPISSGTYMDDVPTNIWSQGQGYRPGGADPS